MLPHEVHLPLETIVQTFIAGVGILSDAYNLFIINLVKNVCFFRHFSLRVMRCEMSYFTVAGDGNTVLSI
jgi:hypothetical protein